MCSCSLVPSPLYTRGLGTRLVQLTSSTVPIWNKSKEKTRRMFKKISILIIISYSDFFNNFFWICVRCVPRTCMKIHHLYTVKMGCCSNTPHMPKKLVGCCCNTPAKSGVLSVHHQGCNSTLMYKGVGPSLLMTSSRMRIVITKWQLLSDLKFLWSFSLSWLFSGGLYLFQ